MARYWVVSPNVWNNLNTLEDWKKRIIKGQVFMGYDRDKPAGEKGKNYMGLQFAGKREPSVQIGDIILIARSRESQDIVGAGIVAGPSNSQPFPESDNQPIQVRKLERFKDLRKISLSEPIQVALGKSLPYKGRAAMRELRNSPEDKEVKKWLDRLLQISDQHDGKSGSSGAPRQLDIQRRHEVEVAAYEAVKKYYEEKDYDVNDVQKDKCGYDLEATKNGSTLKVEVKGRSEEEAVAELTPNEYKHFKNGGNYRLCIVTNVLDPRLKIQKFKFDSKKGKWFDQKGKKLSIERRIGAKVSG